MTTVSHQWLAVETERSHLSETSLTPAFPNGSIFTLDIITPGNI